MANQTQEITINAEFLFEFTSKQHWINKATTYFRSANLSKAEKTVCLDKNGNVLNEGSDFHAAEQANLFPVKVYRLIRTSEAETIETEPTQ